MTSDNIEKVDESVGLHWSQLLAKQIRQIIPSGKITIATGITPSGPIHLGNMREVLTGDAIYKALLKLEVEAELIYIADTFDPLRKIYPFLPKNYEQYVGMPLYNIPDPEGCHNSYSDHFLEPFLRSLETLGIKTKVLLAHQMYKNGMFNDIIAKVLAGRSRIAAIIKEVSGRDLPEDWYPFHIECDNCKKISGTKIDCVNLEKRMVGYTCKLCGTSKEISFENGGGKLSWRVDWPARWKALNISVEPFGKDHAASGGSYETGSRISKEIFSYNPPIPQIYEWIYLKDVGAMSSSTGLGISIQELLEIASPETIRYLVLRSKPEKHIEFEPGNGFLQLSEDYKALENSYFDRTADNWNKAIYELSQTDSTPEKKPLRLPIDHLAIVLQTVGENTIKIREVLNRSGYTMSEISDEILNNSIQKTKTWLNEYAPKSLIIPSPFKIEPDYDRLDTGQKEFLAKLGDNLQKAQWNAEEIHKLIYETSVSINLPAKKAFMSVYIALLNEAKGPRAGWFISSLPRNMVIERFKNAK